MSIAYPGSLSLKQLLENPELLAAPKYDDFGDLKKKTDNQYGNNALQSCMSAYLGPTDLWGDQEAGKMQDIFLDGIKLDDFVLDTELDLGVSGAPSVEEEPQSPWKPSEARASPLLESPTNSVSPVTSELPEKPEANVQQNSDPAFSLDSSELALASIPGEEGFDPSAQAFALSELKPQPLIRKSRKVLVPDSCKDDKYWSRRIKNNVAAKRSREARRIKENQITLRAAYLEQENIKLKVQLEESQQENQKLQQRIAALEQASHQFSPQPPNLGSPISPTQRNSVFGLDRNLHV